MAKIIYSKCIQNIIKYTTAKVVCSLFNLHMFLLVWDLLVLV